MNLNCKWEFFEYKFRSALCFLYENFFVRCLIDLRFHFYSHFRCVLIGGNAVLIRSTAKDIFEWLIYHWEWLVACWLSTVDIISNDHSIRHSLWILLFLHHLQHINFKIIKMQLIDFKAYNVIDVTTVNK